MMIRMVNFVHLNVSFSVLRHFRSFYSSSLFKNKQSLKSSSFQMIVIPVRGTFFQRERRGEGYPNRPIDLTPSEFFSLGFKLLKEESKLFLEEVKEHFIDEPKLYQDGDTEVVFRFDSEESLKKWRIASDKMHNQGYSECNLYINNDRKAVFHGVIDLSCVKDGKIKRAGYCTMRSLRKKKSFRRDDAFNWNMFSHLEMRVKGDGRNYSILLGIKRYIDVMWLDLYSYILFTHGGPYWQTVRIPFSKFYKSHTGRIQDKQQPVPLHRINSVGITCASVPGPFKIEIDYIGVHRSHREEKFAYELYRIPKYIVSD